MIKRWLLLFIFLALFWPRSLLTAAVEQLSFPQPQGHVNDFAEMLSADFQNQLEQELVDFEKETKAEMAVVTIVSLEGDTIENYAFRLFKDWQIGKKKEDNGLLLLISRDDREMRIEVGYGVEPVVTDGRAGRIIREQMRPSFKEENYEEGVSLAIAKLEEYIRSGEPPPASEAASEKISQFLVLFIFGTVFLIWLSAFLGRSKEFITGGILGGLGGGFLGLTIGGLLVTLGMAVLLGGLGLLLDFLFSRNYKKLKAVGQSTGFFPSRGGFSARGRSSFGRGGFGGGSSGGGGASGGW